MVMKIMIARSSLIAMVVLAMAVSNFAYANEDLLNDVPALDGSGGVGAGDEQAWPCCDKCGVCTRSQPPICACEDIRPFSCHPKCEDCQQLPIRIWPPRFRCNDRIVDFCANTCTSKSLDID